MKVTVGDSIFTIPIANIRQSFKVKADQVIKDEYGNEWWNVWTAFIQSSGFIPSITSSEVTQMEDGILLWVEANDRSYCLFVDDLIGEQQVVVKPLPAFLSEFNLKDHGITGCTIMGDGNISIILDILSLYSIAVENA